ncbi:MAG: DNA translocase FtsK [Elusimicrobia bacterium]|nr:DNA translocase FtsK [Candidatus Obscuribacterium magneticum]
MDPRLTTRLYIKTRNRNSSARLKKVDWLAFLLIVAGLFSFFCVLFPLASGLWGRNWAKFLGWALGTGRYYLPLFVSWAGFHLLLRRGKPVPILTFSFTVGLLWSILIMSNLVGLAAWNENTGGIIGLASQRFFLRLFGPVGTWIVVPCLLVAISAVLLKISPGEIFFKLKTLIIEDWKQWKRAKKEPRAGARAPILNPKPGLADTGGEKKPPKIVAPLEGELTKPAPLVEARESLGPVERQSEPTLEETEKKIRVAKTPMSTPKPTPPYQSPQLEIFEPLNGVKSVPKEELTSRAKHLEQTLANFDIFAHVVEIHPGPVITRYDLEPAPGVKVSSITSRADDLALAMRATGIRMLAPIPGKGAVGVEIPNLNPEAVGLRELLSTGEFTNHDSPLAFILGKTVSGEPCIVDLASLPHLLVAGATGVGKSVCIHALICSILYRMPPSIVKFVLIDPKRLELPSYSGIPHLYDPRQSAINAEIITNSKQAAKALARLVNVMEHRYDLFAKANVRNIDSYNQKRKAAGQPPEYFIVVVIDELADLMVTAPKEVEDSVQRLAQMARAVGIHLVLATQRPSVDVITGVIKANLPARIALRVASSTDSRVIIDTAGAECLLGKGDMLYLPPASPEPFRAQGAFVSEKDVENLVAHVRQYGRPTYDDLFASGSVLEFAVEDKKELKDLIEALKLVLERHRVSQDLLKAHFGSSARATNLLSLMEVKNFISKPEGSNRWDIHFDMVEDFLAKANNMTETELLV